MPSITEERKNELRQCVAHLPTSSDLREVIKAKTTKK